MEKPLLSGLTLSGQVPCVIAASDAFEPCACVDPLLIACKLDIAGRGLVAQTIFMTIAISYVSTRAEVWGYYWRLWRTQLWKAHLAIFLVVAGLTYSNFPIDSVLGPVTLWKAGLAGCAPLMFLMLYPILRFKPQLRNLTLSEAGINTSIGRRHGDIPWADVAALEADESSFVIQRSNLNALIVPARAFASPAKRAEFETFVRAHIRPDHS